MQSYLLTSPDGEETLIDENYITPANRLPVIIDSPGTYVMRDGNKALIDTVNPTKTLSTTAFNAQGYMVIPREGRKPKYVYHIWHVSGRFSGDVEEKSKDIIRKD